MTFGMLIVAVGARGLTRMARTGTDKGWIKAKR